MRREFVGGPMDGTQIPLEDDDLTDEIHIDMINLNGTITVHIYVEDEETGNYKYEQHSQRGAYPRGRRLRRRRRPRCPCYLYRLRGDFSCAGSAKGCEKAALIGVDRCMGQRSTGTTQGSDRSGHADL